MGVNRQKPHLFILPEDDANSQIAHGFLMKPHVQFGCVHVMNYVKGWTDVLKKFKTGCADEMKKYPYRIMVLLIDFDNDGERLKRIREEEIPKELSDRVFVLGVQTNPEELKKRLKKKDNISMSFAEIGCALATGCPKDRNELWSDELLQHNKSELDRMIPLVKSFLFNTEE